MCKWMGGIPGTPTNAFESSNLRCLEVDSSIDSDIEVDDLQQTLNDNFFRIDIGSVSSSSDDEGTAKKNDNLKKLNEKQEEENSEGENDIKQENDPITVPATSNLITTGRATTAATTTTMKTVLQHRE
ncbi:unnamed protein product [Didymodactylos carnosus]|uniref:Uncharacterized protein n=1 Tax=Didymodactylos carnosus TaxID=1234261 RepID=A0A813W2A2_9BILA|nr:unnamed protein product [Didymodactylos carnosus]CAF0854939.1 unnamed protein product [Didymodactylos carnosus]CAF3637404.1 unnamed protein product [Didymodactylos carnosus]CAF3640100.1 unnamed protein product [Didymodactylos carnosus]